LREPLLSATAESPEGVKQEAGNAWGARLYGGADLEAPEGQPSPFLQDAGEAAAAAEGEEERVQLTLKPFTLHRRWFTPWALAASALLARAEQGVADQPRTSSPLWLPHHTVCTPGRWHHLPTI
jgi:hypothetical protein